MCIRDSISSVSKYFFEVGALTLSQFGFLSVVGLNFLIFSGCLIMFKNEEVFQKQIGHFHE